MKRLGQLQVLGQVNVAQEAASASIRKQLQQRLRSGCGCDLVPGIRDHRNDPILC